MGWAVMENILLPPPTAVNGITVDLMLLLPYIFGILGHLNNYDFHRLRVAHVF